MDNAVSFSEYSTDNVAKKFRGAVGLANEDEMAAMLQVSHETLATWRTRRKGPPFIKLGKKPFYCINDFALWITSEVDRQSQRSKRRATPDRPIRPAPSREDEAQASAHQHY